MNSWPIDLDQYHDMIWKSWV